jgi:hypothetical protein
MIGAGFGTALSTSALSLPARQNAKRIALLPQTLRLLPDLG